MKNITKFLAIFCIVYSQLQFCQDTIYSIDKLMNAVVYLQDKHPKLQNIYEETYEIGIRRIGAKEFTLLENAVKGTGFFVKSTDKLFLVTADHVARELYRVPSLISSDSNGNAKEFSLRGMLNWKFHKEADVAVTNISNSVLYDFFFSKAIEINFINDSLEYPDAELQLSVIGFPLGLGVNVKFSPLRRETNAASKLLDLKRADKNLYSTFFLLQDPSIGGYSGAPVFAIETYRFGNTIMKGFDAKLCVGLIHGTYSDNTGGKLGMVVPAKYIRDLLK